MFKNNLIGIVVVILVAAAFASGVWIGKDKNKAILNPFPQHPPGFHDDLVERRFDETKLLIPHLFNTICVTGLPKISTQSNQGVDKLKNLLHLSNN